MLLMGWKIYVNLSLCCFIPAYAASVGWPLQLQAPAIARVNQRYQWSLSPTTFTPDQRSHDATALSYSSPHLPDWLSFDPRSGTFSGTPKDEDIGSFTIKVFVSEREDSNSVDSFRLIVSDTAPPTLNIPLAKQINAENPHISSATVKSSGDGLPGLVVPPRWSFSVGFESATFASPTGQPLYYTALLADGRRLPKWLSFDPRYVTFDGVTPTLGDGEDIEMEIAVLGSEVEGHGSVQDHFTISVSSSQASSSQRHHLDVVSPLQSLNVTAEAPFSFDFDNFNFRGIRFDGTDLVRQNISELIVDTTFFPWLAYDPATSRLSGKPPENLLHTPPISLPLTISLKADNLTTVTNVTLVILPSMFTSATLSPAFAPPSTRISFNLDQYFANFSSGDAVANLSVSYSPREASAWILFDPLAHTLSGIVPGDVAYTTLNATFFATSSTTSATSVTSLLINLSPIPDPLSNTRKGGLSGHSKIVVGAVLGTIGGIVLLCCLLAACRMWCTDAEPGGVYVIDHGPHGDRAGAWKLSEETVRGLSKSSHQEKVSALDDMSTVHLGNTVSTKNALIDSRAPSPYFNITNMPVLMSTPPPARKKAFKSEKGPGSYFKKVKNHMAGSMGSLAKRVDKENRPPLTSSASSLRGGGGFSLRALTLGSGPSKADKTKALISRPMPMPLGSAHSALKIGMHTGTSPPGSVVQLSQQASSEDSRILVDPTGQFSSQAMPSSRSLPALEPPVTLNHLPVPSQSGGSEDVFEGGVDRTSWAEEPSYVWASGKMIKTPLPHSTFYLTWARNIQLIHLLSIPDANSAVSASLDSVVPTRRKDFGPPLRTITTAPHQLPETVIQSTLVEPSVSGLRIYQAGSEYQPIPSHRISTASLIDTYRAEREGTEDAVISTANRQHVVGLATPKRSVHSLRRVAEETPSTSQASVGFIESGSGGTSSSSQEEAVSATARLVQFNHERRAGESTHGTGGRSVSHRAVLTSSHPSRVKGPNVTRYQPDLSEDDDERLAQGLDYVRAFGMDGDLVATSTTRSVGHSSTNSPPLPLPDHPPPPPPGLLPTVGSFSSNASSGRSRSLYPGVTSHRRPGRLPGNGAPQHSNQSSVDSHEDQSSLSSGTTDSHIYDSDAPTPHVLRPQPSGLHVQAIRTSTHRILVAAGQPFNFSAPFSASIDTSPQRGALEAKTEDGQELPSWLRFDNKEKEFWGVPPPLRSEDDEIVRVCIWQGGSCLAVFVVEVVDKE